MLQCYLLDISEVGSTFCGKTSKGWNHLGPPKGMHLSICRDKQLTPFLDNHF